MTDIESDEEQPITALGTALGFIGVMFRLDRRAGTRHLWPIHNLPLMPSVGDWIECIAVLQEIDDTPPSTRWVLLQGRVTRRELIDQANGWRCVLMMEGTYE